MDRDIPWNYMARYETEASPSRSFQEFTHTNTTTTATATATATTNGNTILGQTSHTNASNNTNPQAQTSEFSTSPNTTNASPSAGTIQAQLSCIPPFPLSIEEEKRIRAYYAILISTCGQLLELPQQTIATAIVYFHRFYSICPLQAYDPRLCAQAALFLASKVEENSRRVRDVINVAYSALWPKCAPLAVTPFYWDLKENVLRFEQKLLRVLCYETRIRHAHSYCLHICRALECTSDLASVAIYIANDSLCTTLCLQYSASSIACACIYLAAELCGEQIDIRGTSLKSHQSSNNPSTPYSHQEWWEYFGANRLEVEDICHQLIELYESPEQG